MSINITPAMQIAFKNNIELQLQQTKSKLMDACMWDSQTGGEKIKVKDIVGNVMPQKANERHGDTKFGNRTFDGVWIPKPDEIYDADLIDNADRLGTALNLDSSTLQSLAATIARGRDQRILEGFYGPIISGKSGTISTALPAGQTIAVTTGGAAGAQKFNTAKLRAALKLLIQGYADPEAPRYMVLTADDNDQLLQEITVTSGDFKPSYKAEVNDAGQVTKCLGWTFLYCELDNLLLDTIPALSTDGSGYRKTPFWVKGGLVGNEWQHLRQSLDYRPDKLLSAQMFAGTTLAASRTQAGLSGVILNVKG